MRARACAGCARACATCAVRLQARACAPCGCALWLAPIGTRAPACALLRLPQVWGFDIMLDSNLKAWLIEVNTCPALNSDSPLDKHLKTSMVSDLMHLVRVTARTSDTSCTSCTVKPRAASNLMDHMNLPTAWCPTSCT